MLLFAASRYVWLVYRLGRGSPLGPLALVLDQSWLAVYLTLPLVMLLFPDGTLPSRRWRPVLWAYLAVTLCLVLSVYVVLLITLASGNVRINADGGLGALESPSGNTAWISTVTTVVFLMLPAFWLAFVGRLVLSWRRSAASGASSSSGCERFAAGFASGLIGISIDNLDPHAPAAIQAIASSLNDAGVVVLAVFVGVAILKYRLYDIDRIISRTLAYAIVTALLVGVYAGLVLYHPGVPGPYTGGGGRRHPGRRGAVQPVAAAGAAQGGPAVQPRPLRRRPDRGRVAARLKNAVDLDAVRADLASVATKALEPAHVSVWISEPR